MRAVMIIFIFTFWLIEFFIVAMAFQHEFQSVEARVFLIAIFSAATAGAGTAIAAVYRT